MYIDSLKKYQARKQFDPIRRNLAAFATSTKSVAVAIAATVMESTIIAATVIVSVATNENNNSRKDSFEVGVV